MSKAYLTDKINLNENAEQISKFAEDTEQPNNIIVNFGILCNFINLLVAHAAA